MTSYNGEKYIKEQIESIRHNTYTNWNITIYDDGSTDSTCSILSDYEKRYPDKIKFIKNSKNKGVTKNFLEGISSLTTDTKNHHYYMFCDQDDVWMKDKIEKTLKVIKKLERKYKDTPLVVFTDTMVVNEDLDVTEESFFKNSGLNPKNTKLEALLMENKLIGCTVMFNEEVRKKLVNLPPAIRFHDWWIGLIGAAFGQVHYINSPTLYYRQHGNNVVGNKTFAGYVKKSISSPSQQKEALNKTISQGQAFYELYKNLLPKENRKLLYHFSNLNSYNWFKRRYILLKYGFLKTGLIRNIGLFILI